jgi:AraC-like DNA-binding protein
VKSSIACLTNTSISLREVFGLDAGVLEEALLSQEDEAEMIELAEKFLRERLPEQDKNVKVINEIVDCIIAHREITKVDDVVSQLHLNKRRVQRLFREYVGVSPKWVIKRYRLHEVAERLADGEAVDWPTIVVELGYADQAHFIKDFKAIVGKTPMEYAKALPL